MGLVAVEFDGGCTSESEQEAQMKDVGCNEVRCVASSNEGGSFKEDSKLKPKNPDIELASIGSSLNLVSVNSLIS